MSDILYYKMANRLYYNGKIINTEYTNSIVDNIIKLSLKKGDSFQLVPFNNFEDEQINFKKATTKGETMEFHTELKIVDIKISMIESWNNVIKNKVEVFLENNLQTHETNI